MNKKGFTLVELLVVITLIGLLTVIAVPASLTISKKVKQNMMDSKIELIESGAIVWGQNNESEIKTHPTSENCTFSTGYTYCIQKDINDMLNEEKAFKEDKIDEDGITKLLINPTTDENINDCKVEIYIKNKRVYAKYDINTNKSECYYETE